MLQEVPFNISIEKNWTSTHLAGSSIQYFNGTGDRDMLQEVPFNFSEVSWRRSIL